MIRSKNPFLLSGSGISVLRYLSLWFGKVQQCVKRLLPDIHSNLGTVVNRKFKQRSERIFTIAGPSGTPSIAAVMSVFAKLAQTGFAGTGLLLEAFTRRLSRQVIPKLDPKSMDIA